MDNKISKYFEKMQYNFKDISLLKPENKDNSLDLFKNIITDSVAHDFNPKRYNFYIQFMEALNNPEVINNVLYANTIIKSSKEAEAESIRKIVNGLQSLYKINPHTDIYSKDYELKKKAKKEKIDSTVSKKIYTLLQNDTTLQKENDTNKLNGIINATFDVKKATQVGGGKNNEIIAYFYKKIVEDIKIIKSNLNKIKIRFENINDKINEKKANEILKIDHSVKGLINENLNDDDKDKKQLGFLLKDTLYKTSEKQKFDEKPLETFTETVNSILHIKPQEYKVAVETEPIKGITDDAVSTGKVGDNHKGTENTKGTEGAERTKGTEGTERTKGYADEDADADGKGANIKKESQGGYILEDYEYQKLNNLIFDIENDTMRPINKLDISKEDRIVFIGVTFIIRFICLSIIEWGMNTNFVSSFQQIFLFYCAIYITIFCFITMIVNVIYNYPLQQLYTDHSIVNISSMLYYFYIYTNGPMRLVVHLMFIIILMLIPFIINIGNNQFDTIDFNYETKKNTRNILSRFTLVIWIITSIIAIRY